MGARSLVVLLACLAVGLMVGYVAAPGPGATPPVRGSGPPVSSSDPELGDPPPAPPSARVAHPFGGTGEIEGTVTTPDGMPVAGVVVTACRPAPREDAWRQPPQPVSSRGPPDLDRELATRIARYERDHRHRAASRRDAISGEDGRFVLRGLDERRYMIQAFREGFHIQAADDERWLSAGETTTLIATPVVRLPVSVVHPDGSEAAAAEIRINGGFEQSEGWSPRRSVLAVPPGPLTLTAYARDEQLMSEAVDIVVPETSPAERVVLTLAGPQGIRGTVTFPPDVNPAFHDVVALELPPGAGERPERLIKEGRTDSLTAGSGPTATYRMRDLVPGRYLLGVVRRDQSVAISRVVTVGHGMETHDLFLPGAVTAGPEAEPEVKQRSTLVRVLAPDGTPEVWAKVRAYFDTPRRGWTSLGKVKRVEPGAYRVFAGSPGSDGTCIITAYSKQYGDRELAFDPVNDLEIVIRLTEPAFVKVVLPDYLDGRYEGRTRIVVARPGRMSRSSSFRTEPGEPDGSRSFGPLEPGVWEVVVWYGTGKLPFHVRQVTLAAGRQEIPIELPPVIHLDVLVTGEDGEKGFYLRRLDGPWGGSSPEVVATGRIRFDGLQPGEYVLSRHHGPRQHMPLSITGDTTVRFQPIVLDGLRVEITNRAGALAQSGLEHGDLLLEFDGYEVNSGSYGWVLEQLGGAKESVTLTIRRGGADLKLTVQTAGFTDPKRSGGEIRPWRK